jgi:hypothetical protein
MTTKDTVVGTTKRLIAEIVGDGALADEGSRQANGTASIHHSADHACSDPERNPPRAEATISNAETKTEHDRFALLLGHAALSVWPDLPRDAQEQLFASAVDDGIIANSLAVFLHDRRPKTAHPARPPQIA